MTTSKKSRRVQPPASRAPAKPFSSVIICIGLAAVTLLVFWPALNCGFVSYDDPVYVTENSRVLNGLTLDNVKWAFTSLDAGFWQPLVWLSYMLDFQVFGLRPAGFHLTNLLLHIANTLLLFVALDRMTKARWRSAIVAALFALHPLHVESVAWIAERKDVLSTLFWMLALWTYVRYAEESRIKSPKAKVFYGLALLFFVGGLMSKTMVVTLPVVLLLLDGWPLNRISNFKFQISNLRLVLEKLPFFVPGFVSILLTFRAEKMHGALGSTADFPLPLRAANAVFSGAEYLAQTFRPANLAVFYPFPKAIPFAATVSAGLLILICSVAALFLIRKRAWFAVGWFWYLVTLLPVIGLIQIGGHARADRYTYIPLIGIFVVLVWGTGEALSRWRVPKSLIAAISALLLAACGAQTVKQLSYWQNDETLFRHAIAVTKDNAVAHYDLGHYLESHGQTDEAVAQYEEAVRINPNYGSAHNNLANIFVRNGNSSAAIEHYRASLRVDPDSPAAHSNLGAALAQSGQLDEAIQQYNEALRLNPNLAGVHNNLGYALVLKGQSAEAIAHYRKALELDVNYTAAYVNLANALAARGEVDAAIADYQRALQLNPNHINAHYRLGLVLVRKGLTTEAIAQFNEALRLKPDFAEAKQELNNLGVRTGD